MAQRKQAAGTRESEQARRVARAHRILNAAGELITRWGYQKTTLDDISRQAKVAKATIYLHWKTREDLFEALITREKLEVRKEMRQRIQEDPEGATLRGMLKHSALGFLKRPLLRATLLSDVEMLGKMAQSSQNQQERLAGFTAYLDILRTSGLARTDLSMKAQGYMLSAIFSGFLFIAPLMPTEYQLSDQELADLMAEAIHRTLEPDTGFPAAALQTASSHFLQYLDHAINQAQEQFQRELESYQTRREEPSR